MEGKSFAKLAKDAKLIDKHLTATDVDLIFAKIKVKTERRITYQQFRNGLEMFAEKKGVSPDDLVSMVLQSGGPKFSGTKAEKVKYHDDKSQYTGVHANGGPTTVDAGRGAISDISQLCDRTDADKRGVKKAMK